MSNDTLNSYDQQEGDYMKRVFSLSLVLALAIMIFVPVFGGATAYAKEWGERSYRINKSKGLDILEEPDDKAWIVVSLNQGDRVVLRGTKGKWAKVETDKGYVGYCYKKYLTRPGVPLGDPDEAPKKSGALAFISKDGKTKVYKKPSTSSKVVGKVKAGTVVKLLEYKGQWGRIQHKNGNTGFVLLENIDKYTKKELA